jgi:hypothetical protein
MVDNSWQLLSATMDLKHILWLAMAYTSDCMEKAHAYVTRCVLVILFLRNNFAESCQTFIVTLSDVEPLLVSRPNLLYHKMLLNCNLCSCTPQSINLQICTSCLLD